MDTCKQLAWQWKKMHHWFGVSPRWFCHELVFSSGRGTFSDSVYLVNALFSKWTDKNINLLFFVLAFICEMDLGIVLLDGDFSQFTTMVTVTCACTVFSWALNFALLQSVEVDGAAKKIVMSFLATVCSAVIMAAVFVGSIWLAS